jgi:hypothetical protein
MIAEEQIIEERITEASKEFEDCKSSLITS